MRHPSTRMLTPVTTLENAAAPPWPDKDTRSMTASTDDPRVALLAAPMSTYQKMGVAVVVFLCMLDGLDVMAITFVAPAIKAAWGISQGQIGWILASGLLGMAVGSLLIAPLADLIGRRRMIFVSLVFMILGTIWSALTTNVTEMAISRVFTGLGIGTMIAVISSLAAEYSNTRSRDFAQSMFAVGFPVGGMLGGVLAGVLLPSYGWTAIFWVGSAVGLVMAVVVWLFLPEPIAPMIARPRADTLDRVNAYLKRCGMAPISKLPPPPEGAKAKPIKALFAPGMAGATMMVTAIYFLHVITLFFVQSWAPSLVANMGFKPNQAALIAVWVNVGGIVGIPIIGAITMRVGLKPLVLAALAFGAAMTAVFGSIPPTFVLLSIGAFFTGLGLQSGMMGLYAVIARTFPAHMRVSGIGFVIGVGRFGSAIGPAAAGALLAAGLTGSMVAVVLAVPTMLAAMLLYKFAVRPPDTP